MKKVLGIVAIGAAIFAAGCGPNPALYSKLFYPVNKIVKAGPVWNLQVRHPDYVSVGEVFEATAEAQDENYRAVKTNVRWEVNKEDVLELLQTEGQTVEIKVLKPFDVAAHFTAYAVDDEGEVIEDAPGMVGME